MAEPTLTAVFGTNASQTATTLTIDKADLAGLTPLASNTAESLLAAIALKAKNVLTQANFDSNLDQSVVVADGFDSIISRDNGTGTFVSYRQNQLNINLHKLDAGAIDPDDY